MSTRKQELALVGAGAAACTACCAGPILGFLAAIGLGTVLGAAIFGMIGLVIAAVGIIAVVRRRRRRTRQCAASADQPVIFVGRG